MFAVCEKKFALISYKLSLETFAIVFVVQNKKKEIIKPKTKPKLKQNGKLKNCTRILGKKGIDEENFMQNETIVKQTKFKTKKN